VSTLQSRHPHARGNRPSRVNSERGRHAELLALGVLDTLPEPLLDELTVMAAHWNECSAAAIAFADTDRLWLKAAVGLKLAEFPRHRSFCEVVVATRATLAVRDARADQRFRGSDLLAAMPSIRSYLGAPLVTDSRAVLGTLCLFDTRVRAWSSEDRHILELLARQVIAQLELRKEKRAMVHVREDYNRATENHRSMLRQAHRFWGVAMREGMAQELAGISYVLQATKADCQNASTAIALSDVQRLMGVALQHCLQISHGSSHLEEIELRASLQRQLAITEATTGIACTLHWLSCLRIENRLTSHALLQITQEAIRNAVRHASCCRIHVSCEERDGFITLDITDDGRGLAVDATLGEGMGVEFMRFCAQALLGRLHLLPATPQGLTVRCVVSGEQSPIRIDKTC
jgi:two-component sensor histidine kinase